MKYTNVQLIFPEYHPDQLEKGMYFVSMHGLVQDNPYVHIYELDSVPRDQGKYIEKHGLPVRPYLVMNTSTNPDVPPKVVAEPHQIYLSVEQMNYCSARGYVELLTYDDGEPVLEKNGDVVFYIDQEFDDIDDDDDWEYDTFNNEEMI
jgi:hypothetical protein